MSVASSSSSFPCMNLTTPSTTTSPSSSSSPPSSSSSTSSTLRYSIAKHSNVLLTIRSSQSDQGPLRRPVVQPTPPIKPVPPSSSPPPPQPQPPSSSSPPPPPPPKKVVAAVGAVEDKNVMITLEFQRQKAKELQDYFKKKKLEEADQGPFFGFIGKNEIANGRWAMFGFAVGLLTEYATGLNFVDQINILLSNFGIVDLE